MAPTSHNAGVVDLNAGTSFSAAARDSYGLAIKRLRQELPPEARAHFAYHRSRDLKTQGERLAKQKRIAENNDQIAALVAQIGAMERSYEKAGTKPAKITVDPKTGNRKSTEIDWRGPLNAQIAALKRENNELHAEIATLPKDSETTILEGLNALRFKPLRNAPTLHPARRKGESEKAMIGRLNAACDAAIEERKAVQLAPRTHAEADAILDRQIPAMIARGKPNVRPAYQGGRITHSGGFSPSNPHARLQFPEINLGILRPDFEPVMAQNAIAFVAWLLPDIFESRLRELVASAARDEKAIAEAEKPAALRAAEASILQAERECEAAVRDAEVNGMVIERRSYESNAALVMLALEIGDPEESIGQADDDFNGDDA